MAEGDYEYEKMRCELLGLPPPEMKTDAPKDGNEGGEEESGEAGDDVEGAERLDAAQELDVDNEHMKNISGGLDEINSILSVTQKKLNKFKVVCGSLTNLLKLKVGTSRVDEATSSNNSSQVATDTEEETGNQVTGGGRKVKGIAGSGKGQQQKDISQMIDSQNDALDAMLEKSDRAILSMNMQRNQMKQYLRK